MAELLENQLIRIFNLLSRVPFNHLNRDEALNRVVELGRQAMGSHSFILAFFDFEYPKMREAYCSSCRPDMEEYMKSRNSNPSSKTHIDPNLIGEGKPIEAYDLKQSGKGVANPKIAAKFGFDSLLAHPLHSEGGLIGYVNHLKAGSTPFHEFEKKLLETLANQITVIIDRFTHQQEFDESLEFLNDLMKGQDSISTDGILDLVPEKACELLSVPICVIWKLDTNNGKMKVAAVSKDISEDYKQVEWDFQPEDFKQFHLHRDDFYIPNISRLEVLSSRMKEAQKRGWISLLGKLLRYGGATRGLIEIYTKEKKNFKDWEINSFGTYANHAASQLQKAELLEETRNLQKDQKRLEKLTEIMLEVSRASDEERLFRSLLDGAVELVGQAKGVIHKLIYLTGDLETKVSSGGEGKIPRLPWGKGFTGKALLEEEVIIIKDVTAPGFKNIYIERWPGMRSEMAIPLMIERAGIREGHDVLEGSKRLGVLNIESSIVDAFTDSDKKLLWSLARLAAMRVDRFDSDKKWAGLRDIDKEIRKEEEPDTIIKIVMKGIKDLLGFEYVNISIVIPEQKCIRTEHVIGIPENQEQEFKKRGVYPLDDKNIYGAIYRSRETEVPSAQDKRLDRQSNILFRLDRLVRVFVPMIEPLRNQVIGMLEAGYNREIRKHVYERDIPILQSFVDYVVQALERKKSGILEKITHEFRAPIIGIRTHAGYLRRRYKELSAEYIDNKLNDISTDCEILLSQIDEWEYAIGNLPQKSRITKTLVIRDVFIKSLNQLKPVMAERGFSFSDFYDSDDIGKVIAHTDPTKLSQVAFNLIMNSIKYAEEDPKEFRIKLEVVQNKNSFVIKLKDWGIGIKDEYVDKLFDRGFRTPEAEDIDVTGRGLGLTISKGIMKQLGGDLKLANNHKPTEFHVILPRKYRGDIG